VLRERGRHIALLEEELATKNQWLEKAAHDHEELLAAHRVLQEELGRSNQWAHALNHEVQERRARVAALQQELIEQQEGARKVAEGYAAKVTDLEEDIRARTQWALDTESRLNAEVQEQVDELGQAVEALHRTERELEERTAWALRLEEEGRRLEERLGMVRASRWVRLGRKVGLGPDLPTTG
jgi:SMC interacting uncharacterized protein involved in chromosome segregation